MKAIPGASISLDEQKRITDALAELEKDPHAPREISVKLTLHVHNEYPKHVYKTTGKVTELLVVNNEEEEEDAIAKGYGDYVAPVTEEATAAPAQE